MVTSYARNVRAGKHSKGILCLRAQFTAHKSAFSNYKSDKKVGGSFCVQDFSLSRESFLFAAI